MVRFAWRRRTAVVLPYSHDGTGNYFGGPWQGEGIGRIWPIFTGERGEYEIAAGA